MWGRPKARLGTPDHELAGSDGSPAAATTEPKASLSMHSAAPEAAGRCTARRPGPALTGGCRPRRGHHGSKRLWPPGRGSAPCPARRPSPRRTAPRLRDKAQLSSTLGRSVEEGVRFERRIYRDETLALGPIDRLNAGSRPTSALVAGGRSRCYVVLRRRAAEEHADFALRNRASAHVA